MKVREDALREIDLQTAEDAGKEADKDGRDQDVAPRIVDIFREGADAIKAAIGKSSNRSAGGDVFPGEGAGIVERSRGQQSRPALRMKEPARGHDDEYEDDSHHDDHHDEIGSSRCANAAKIDDGDQRSKERRPDHIGNLRNQPLNGQRAVDGADERYEQVIEQHGPAREKTEMQVEARPT